jgi:hypothetical protein
MNLERTRHGEHLLQVHSMSRCCNRIELTSDRIHRPVSNKFSGSHSDVLKDVRCKSVSELEEVARVLSGRLKETGKELHQRSRGLNDMVKNSRTLFDLRKVLVQVVTFLEKVQTVIEKHEQISTKIYQKNMQEFDPGYHAVFY